MGKRVTAEQKARDMLFSRGVEDALDYSAGEVVALANLIAEDKWDQARWFADGFAEAWKMGAPEVVS